MYRLSYAEILNDDQEESREREWLVLGRAIELLKMAQDKGANSAEAKEAAYYLHRLWSFFIEDLLSPQNGLPEEVRAALVSIGMYIVKEADRIQRGESENLAGLIEINTTVRNGLK